MDKKDLEILVVEDNERHLKDAQDTVENLGFEALNIVASYATNKEEALDKMAEKQYDVVISDIFMPSTTYGTEQADRCAAFELVPENFKGGSIPAKFTRAIGEWKNGNKLAPLGMLIADECLKSDTPMLFCTDTYHHGAATEPVNVYARDEKIPVVDINPHELGVDPSSDPEEWGASKDWDCALRSACAMNEVISLYNEGLLDVRNTQKMAECFTKYQADDRHAFTLAGRLQS